MRAAVFTLGCKVNEVESASIMAALEGAGYEVTDRLCPADIYVLNTCAVTREAERKSRQLVARAKKFNPSARVYVCGCASEKSPKDFSVKGVTYVCGAQKKERIVGEICGDCAALPYPKHVKTRAFIKIQDGCNNFCSYCVIPYLRGREISRSIGDICGEIAVCAAPEIVLTGINISAYNDGGRHLKELIEAIHNVDKRVRLGSLECNVITESFLNSLKGLKDFAPQFHLSLQSGSTSVLRAMNRHYTREDFLNRCGLIYKHFPAAAITTDIISGFPTETEEDFGQSLSIIKEGGFARVHAFSFSPREGTAAYKLKDLPAGVKSERLHRLVAAAKEAETQYVSRFLGSEADFIAEEEQGGFTAGYTANYIRVYLPGRLEAGVKYKIKLLSPHADGALAELTEGTK